MENISHSNDLERRKLGRSLSNLIPNTDLSICHRISFVLIVLSVSISFLCTNGLSQQSSPPLSPGVFVNIPRWEDRSSYPRFILYRDHFRRHLEYPPNKASNPLVTYSKPESPNVPSLSAILTPNNGVKSNNSPLKISNFHLNDKSNDDDDDDGDVEGNNDEYSDEDDILSLERLLAERNGILSKKTNNNAKNSYDDISTVNNGNPDKEITFPKDKTNPCNRLQINPEDLKINLTGYNNGVTHERDVSSQLNSTNESGEKEVDSFELGNRGSFSSQNYSNESIGSSEQAPDQDEEDSGPGVEELIKDAVPTFDLTMNIIKLSEWTEENVVFSPLSIANVLSIIMLGAGGKTFDELATLLNRQNSSLSTSVDSVLRYHHSFKMLNSYLRDMSGEKVELSSASQVFVHKTFPVLDRFVQDLQNYYEAPLESLDFGKDGLIFQEKVNKWVKEKTRGQIQSIMDEPPSAATTMGIVNAIYFKGPWEIPFSEKLTRWKEFQVGPKEKTKVQMMVNIMSVPYMETEAYKMVALPYKENRTGLYIILPKGNDGIEDLKNVEKILTKEQLKDSIFKMNDTKVAVSLPKMKYSSDGRMEEILRKVHLSTVFSPSNANFSKISSSEDLYISSLIHRAVIEINEKGTEASAVSLGTGDRIIEDLPLPFKCDKPFLFFIYHVKADTILFWGRVIRPTHFSR